MAGTAALGRAALAAVTAGVVFVSFLYAVDHGLLATGPSAPARVSRVATAPAAHTGPAPTAPAPTTVAPTPPPSTAAPTTAAPAPLAGETIAIDPGHNGANGQHPDQINQPVPAGGFTKPCDTTGAETSGGYTESLFNLNVATYLANDLRALGATVVMTRTSNDGVGPCVNQRAAIGNAAHAAAAISIHGDGGPVSGRGFEVIQPGDVPGYPPTSAIVGPSHALALAVRDGYAAGSAMPVSDYVGSGGLDTRTDLAGLNLSTVPKVFIECGNLNNPTDAGLLVTPVFQQRAAQGIAAGLVAYLRH